MSFNQLAPSVPTVLNTSNCFVFGNTASGNALSVQQLGAGNVFRFSNAAGLSNVMVMNNLGQVGIGTTNPGWPLDVLSSGSRVANFVSSANGSGNIRFQCTDGTTPGTGFIGINAFNNSVFGLGSSTGIPTVFYQNGTEYMRIHTNGNVGIGVANPSYQLTVTSNIYNTSAGGGFYGTNCGNLDAYIQGVYNGGATNPDGLTNSDLFIGVNYNQQTGQRIQTAGAGAGVAQIQLVGGNGSAGQIKFRCLANGIGAVASIPTIATINPTGLTVNGSIGMVGGTSIPVTLPATGSQTSYSITLAASGTWYTVIDARINATITGAIGQSDLTSTIFIATLTAAGSASASMTLVTGNAANIRVSGGGLQFLANGSSYGLICGFTLIRHN